MGYPVPIDLFLQPLKQFSLL